MLNIPNLLLDPVNDYELLNWTFPSSVSYVSVILVLPIQYPDVYFVKKQNESVNTFSN